MDIWNMILYITTGIRNIYSVKMVTNQFLSYVNVYNSWKYNCNIILDVLVTGQYNQNVKQRY